MLTFRYILTTISQSSGRTYGAFFQTIQGAVPNAETQSILRTVLFDGPKVHGVQEVIFCRLGTGSEYSTNLRRRSWHRDEPAFG